MGTLYRIIAFGLFVLLAGCPTSESQLQNVAKDWSLLIRASQIIPVYPLTEDLQPGDIFLVETPIQEQAKEYSEKGYLRLDQQLARLQDLAYWEFYGENGYGLEETSKPPRNWQEAGGASSPEPDPAPDVPARHTDLTRWPEAPHAAFPTYNFSIKQGQGLDLALPIQGVPVGLSLMRTQAASGMVTIADSYTYGVSLDQLNEKVEEWARDRKRLLDDIRGESKEIYLRVVYRVYLTGRVVVSMTNSESAGGDLAVGAGSTDRQALFDISEGEGETRRASTAAAYAEMLTDLNTSLSDTLPRARVKVVGASSRAVSLSETFPRPLVIGYLSFDYPILEGGWLGAPVATREVLRRKGDVRRVRLGKPNEVQEDYAILFDAVTGRPEEKQRQIFSAAAAALGEPVKKAYEKQIAAGKTPSKAFRAATGMPPSEFNRSPSAWTRHLYGVLRKARSGAE